MGPSVSPGSRRASTLAAWHERFGRKEVRATVLAGQATDVSFRY
jgi:hypothetical protein